MEIDIQNYKEIKSNTNSKNRKNKDKIKEIY